MNNKIKELVLNLGADVCGIAHIDQFDHAPEGFHPKDIFNDCKSVIVFGIALPKGLTKVNSSIIYAHYNEFTCNKADKIALMAAKIIEEEYQGIAVPMPCDGPYEYWDEQKLEGRGLLSMKHAAVLAGLGVIGKSSMLLNKTYGTLLTIGATLTNLDLPSDELAENICKDNCRLCVDNCPTNALDGVSVNQFRCRQYTYSKNARGFSTVNCNKCRTICPMRYGSKLQGGVSDDQDR